MCSASRFALESCNVFMPLVPGHLPDTMAIMLASRSSARAVRHINVGSWVPRAKIGEPGHRGIVAGGDADGKIRHRDRKA